MAQLYFKFFLVAALVAVIAGKPYDFVSILQKIPEDQRLDFVKYHLNLGYELTRNDMEMKENIPENLANLPAEFSTGFYEFARKQAKVVICFPSGECVDIGDNGVHPKK